MKHIPTKKEIFDKVIHIDIEGSPIWKWIITEVNKDGGRILHLEYMIITLSKSLLNYMRLNHRVDHSVNHKASINAVKSGLKKVVDYLEQLPGRDELFKDWAYHLHTSNIDELKYYEIPDEFYDLSDDDRAEVEYICDCRKQSESVLGLTGGDDPIHVLKAMLMTIKETSSRQEYTQGFHLKELYLTLIEVVENINQRCESKITKESFYGLAHEIIFRIAEVEISQGSIKKYFVQHADLSQRLDLALR